MNLKIFQWRSLQTRVTFLTLAVFVLSIWTVAYYANRSLREDMQRLLGQQQFSTVSIVAAQVDAALEDRLRGLERYVTGRMTPDMLSRPAAMQARLEDSPNIQSMFNGGVFVTDVTGTAIASVPVAAGRVGTNYIERDHIAAALREVKTTVSKPVIGKTLRAPLIAMAAPIRDSQGKVIGALVGVVDLSKPNFLDVFVSNRYGNTGGYILVAIEQRLVITATDKSRIMQPLAPPSVIPQTDRFLQGFDGYAVYRNPRGEEVLNSSKRLTATQWNVAATMPTAEAFAPIRAVQAPLLLITGMLTLLAGTLTWWLLRRQLAPLTAAVKALATMSASDQAPQPLPVIRHDEIGALIGGFNGLLGTLRQRELALTHSEQDFRALFMQSPTPLALIDTTGNIAFINNKFTETFGYSRDDIPNVQAWWTHIYPDPSYRAELQAAWTAAAEEAMRGDGNAAPMEVRFTCKNGTLRYVVISSVVIRERMLITLDDITDRKRIEEQVRQMAFYDPLTQLPNRRLLDDRLRQVMAASKRSGCRCALMFLDLDNFKLVNDVSGHGVGDLLLVEAAKRLAACVREVDTVARFGGDEFVVLLGELNVSRSESTEQARSVAEEIRVSLSAPYLLAVQNDGAPPSVVEHRCSASIGVVVFMKHEASQDEILKWADDTMYQAKNAGPNSILFYEAASQLVASTG